ncbi:lipase member M [Hyalella azteca]|uniref:Lipase n=1 Tax=Hyalella azteca TaxID=294128 RepID=A0A8B7NUT4_HYAAZ|nr:lipase member M [Hyalella azteca]
MKFDVASLKLTSILKSAFSIPNDLYFDSAQLARSRGYGASTHHVTTKDGYIIALHRLLPPPNSSRGPPARTAGAVLMMSSPFGSSSDFIINEPHQSLGYLLVDAGYDVWLGNFRGSRYGLNHTRLNDDDPRFWRYSFDEIAQFDLPAQVNFVLERTGEAKIFFFCYSASTMAFFMSGTPKTSFMNKIRLAVTFAPIGDCRHPTKYIRTSARLMLIIQDVAEKVTRGPLYRGSDLLSSVLYALCHGGSPFRRICVFVVTSLMGGTNKGYYGKNGFPYALASVLSGMSVKALAHFAQQAFTPRLRMYDYGSPAANRAAYGFPTPPHYNMSDVTAPVVVCSAPNDSLMSLQDQQMLMQDLPYFVKRILAPQKDYGHLDLVYAKNAKEVIYNEIIELMKNY